MSLAEAGALLVATIQAAGAGAVFILVLMIGASFAFDVFKLRQSGPKSLTVRSLDEALGTPESYLPPSTPRGTTDQLGNSQRAA
ncbi:MAG: hypothetical protein R6V57_16075 [Vicinamibacterales bacterium]